MNDPSGASRASSQTTSESHTSADNGIQVALYATAIFASAFLIFLVQPMIGKRILPWFGGVPAVWTLCLAFYQSTLFLGYAYAHFMIRFVRPGLQPWIHAAVVTAAIFSLPVLPVSPPELRSDVDPTTSVLRILASNVALPFLVLAATGPLAQAWFARIHPTTSPYRLYAVSNVGSLLALFIYPFVLEPRLSLPETGALWNGGFAVTGLLVLVCALPLARIGGAPIIAGGESGTEPAEGPGMVRSLIWLLLSGTAVVLLMGVTNKLCLDVASIPFLWIVPLATYLITFILAFSSERTYRRGPYVIAALGSFLMTRTIASNALIVYQILPYCALLFTTCMILHGELYRSRPSPRALTAFYLCVSLGGAIGGLFVGIAAPRIFDDYYELQVGLLVTALLVLLVTARNPGSFMGANGGTGRWAAVVSLTLAFVGYFVWLEVQPQPLRIYQKRSFFGVLKVDAVSDGSGEQRSLTSGTTIHGVQSRNRSARMLPTAYFGRATGLGLALTSRPRDAESRIGVIGLGVGTLAAYGRRGDSMRFYEIDPVVAEVSGPGGYFSFVEDSKADVEIVLGDARLAIEDEQRRGELQDFDFLVVDAFSSDAIPVHLMTREAFARYFDALAPDGLMAVHVSNRHFRLMNLVSGLAAELGAHSLQVSTLPAPTLQSGRATSWVIIAREIDQLTRLRTRMERRHRALELPPASLQMRYGSDVDLESISLWTDDYSDILSVVRWD